LVNQELSWVGLDLGDYKIDLKLGGGIFSNVYRGVHIKTAQKKAFKVAKPQDLVCNPPREDCLSTRAIAQTTGSTMVVLPDAAKLIKQQHSQLSAQSQPGWIKVDGLVEQPALTYYEMDFVEGETLRQAMTRKPISIDKTIEIVRCLDKLCKDASGPTQERRLPART
jgi:serine/threonine protein kinase